MNRLKKLKRRFMIIIMGVITVMLSIILSIVLIGNIQHYESVASKSLHMLVNMTNPVNTFSSESDRGAQRFQDANRSSDGTLSVDQDDDTTTTADNTPPPETGSTLSAGEQKAAAALPGIVVGVDEDYQNVRLLFTRNMDTSLSTAEKLVEEVHSLGKTEGSLSKYDLSYLVRQTPEGTKIAFVDRSYERSSVQNLVLWAVLGFIVAWLAFLLLVWRLSGWVFRPVELAWSQQRQFIADASHELKTPLTVILANMRILENHKDDRIAEQIRWIESSDQEALRMKKLVSDMLLLARNDANEDQTLASAPVNFSDVVLGAILSFEAVALDNGLRIREELVENAVIDGDKAQLEELVNILMDNACKYAPAGSTITVTLTTQERALTLEVHNKGEHLDDEALEQLFDRFYRVDASRTRETGGYGLGLAIAESICRRHSGRIAAANDGDGVTFQVTLPLQQRHKK